MSATTKPTNGQARRKAAALMLFPALAIVTAYVYLPRASAERDIAALEARVVEARRSVPSLAAQAGLDKELESLRRTAEELRKEAAAAIDETQRRPGAHADPAARAAAVEDVVRLLAKHRLLLTEESTAPIGVEASAIPMLRGERGSVRTLHFRGAYFDVLAALNELMSGQVNAFPLQLAMKRSRDEEGVLLWTLVLI